jgi:hypothetical protein
MKNSWVELAVPVAISGIGVTLGLLTYLNLI